MSENYPQVVRRSKPVRDWKGKTIPERDTTIQPASPLIHSHTGSAGAAHASEYATVLNPEVAGSYQDSTASDFSKRTPRAADWFVSIQVLMPAVHLGLTPEDLAESAPEDTHASRNLDPKKPKLLSHIEGE